MNPTPAPYKTLWDALKEAFHDNFHEPLPNPRLDQRGSGKIQVELTKPLDNAAVYQVMAGHYKAQGMEVAKSRTENPEAVDFFARNRNGAMVFVTTTLNESVMWITVEAQD